MPNSPFGIVPKLGRFRTAQYWRMLAYSAVAVFAAFVGAIAIAWHCGFFIATFPEVTVPERARVVFSPRGTEYLAIEDSAGGILTERNLSGQALWTYPRNGLPRNVCYLDDQRIVILEGSDVVIWDRQAEQELKRIPTPPNLLINMKVSPSGDWLVLYDWSSGTIAIVDLFAGKFLTQLAGENLQEYDIYPRADISLVAFTEARDELIRVQNSGFEVWRLKPLQRIRVETFPEEKMLPFPDAHAISERGRYLATWSVDDNLQLWDLGENRCVFERRKHRDPNSAVLLMASGFRTAACQFVANDSVLLTSGSWNERRIRTRRDYPFIEWNWKHGKEIAAWKIHAPQRIRTWRLESCYGIAPHPIQDSNDFIANIDANKYQRFRVR